MDCAGCAVIIRERDGDVPEGKIEFASGSFASDGDVRCVDLCEDEPVAAASTKSVVPFDSVAFCEGDEGVVGGGSYAEGHS